MSVNGKRDDFEPQDLYALVASGGVKKTRAKAIFRGVAAAIAEWPEHAAAAGIGQRLSKKIQQAFRRELGA